MDVEKSRGDEGDDDGDDQEEGPAENVQYLACSVSPCSRLRVGANVKRKSWEEWYHYNRYTVSPEANHWLLAPTRRERRIRWKVQNLKSKDPGR